MKAGADVLGLAVRTRNGRRLGTVHDLLFDDACTRVVGLVIRSGFVFRARQVIGFSEVQEFRASQIVVGGANTRRPNPDEVAALSTDGRSMQGRAVVNGGGESVGVVRDVLFDEESGGVLGFEVANPKGAGQRSGGPRVWSVWARIAADKVIVSDAQQPSGS